MAEIRTRSPGSTHSRACGEQLKPKTAAHVAHSTRFERWGEGPVLRVMSLCGERLKEWAGPWETFMRGMAKSNGAVRRRPAASWARCAAAAWEPDPAAPSRPRDPGGGAWRHGDAVPDESGHQPQVPTPAASEPSITQAQLKKLHALANELGLDREQKLAGVAATIGREVESTNDLTKAVAPHVERAREELGPRLQEARDQVGPRLQDAREQVGPRQGGRQDARGVIAQRADGGQVRLREDVRARGEQLAELDEGRAELLERHAHALRRLEGDGFGDRAAVQDLPGALEHAGDADALHEVAQAVADEDRADRMQARQVPHEAYGFPQHQRAFGGSGFFCNASATPERMPLSPTGRITFSTTRHPRHLHVVTRCVLQKLHHVLLLPPFALPPHHLPKPFPRVHRPRTR